MEIEEKYINRLTKEINVAAKYGWEVVTTIFNGEKYIALLRTESNESVYKPETFKFRVQKKGRERINKILDNDNNK